MYEVVDIKLSIGELCRYEIYTVFSIQFLLVNLTIYLLESFLSCAMKFWLTLCNKYILVEISIKAV